MKKKTHEEYVYELAIKNPTVEVIENYIDAKTPIMHHCLIHDVYWKAIPGNTLKGKGCKECNIERRSKKRTKTHDEYVAELIIKNPDIEAVEKYNGANNLIMHHCLVHDIYWETTPARVLSGNGCKECQKDKFKKVMSKGHESYVKELAIKNPTVEVVGEYKNINTPILHRCLTHDIFWETSPASALQGCGCHKCRSEKVSQLMFKTHKEYVDELKKKNPNVEVVEEYKGMKEKILHHCLIHNIYWDACPSNVLKGCGCPKCVESKGERRIGDFLLNNNILNMREYIFDDCRDKNPLPYDFYLPDYNICIEYQGRQHYEPVEHFGGEEYFKIQQKHDQIKKEYCDQNDIHLLYIPYWEYKNIENIILDCLKLYELKKK